MKNEITEVAEVAEASFEVNSSKASSISAGDSKDGHSTLEAWGNVGQAVGNVAATTALLVGDLNGDGKVDIEDAKIALAKAKQVASFAANESIKLGKEVMQSELVKDVTPYAAIGAAIAVPIPIVGPVIGAALGAVLGLYKNATKRK